MSVTPVKSPERDNSDKVPQPASTAEPLNENPKITVVPDIVKPEASASPPDELSNDAPSRSN